MQKGTYIKDYELLIFLNSLDDESHCTQYISIFILSVLVDHLEQLCKSIASQKNVE